MAFENCVQKIFEKEYDCLIISHAYAKIIGALELKQMEINSIKSIGISQVLAHHLHVMD